MSISDHSLSVVDAGGCRSSPRTPCRRRRGAGTSPATAVVRTRGTDRRSDCSHRQPGARPGSRTPACAGARRRGASFDLAHRRAIEFEPVGVVDDAIEDGIAESGSDLREVAKASFQRLRLATSPKRTGSAPIVKRQGRRGSRPILGTTAFPMDPSCARRRPNARGNSGMRGARSSYSRLPACHHW